MFFFSLLLIFIIFQSILCLIGFKIPLLMWPVSRFSIIFPPQLSPLIMEPALLPVWPQAGSLEDISLLLLAGVGVLLEKCHQNIFLPCLSKDFVFVFSEISALT